MDVQRLRRAVNPLKQFDFALGHSGEIYLFHYGRFVSSCESWLEIQEEQERVLEQKRA